MEQAGARTAGTLAGKFRMITDCAREEVQSRGRVRVQREFEALRDSFCEVAEAAARTGASSVKFQFAAPGTGGAPEESVVMFGRLLDSEGLTVTARVTQGEWIVLTVQW